MTTIATLSDAADILRATGVCGRAKREGDMAPDVNLTDTAGAPVKLSALWRSGPLVVIFYRGGWCSYCNLQLHAWQQHASELKRLGAALVAISPQTPEHSQDTMETNALPYALLSDSSLNAANGFGIAYTLPPELIDLYASSGTDIPVLNGNGQWVLPIPATYVVDPSGRIRFAHVETDYRERIEPWAVIEVLEQATR
ncbi:peroxiredoxin-like family protein [Variovorax sp. MHTC-1]|uniref:peroxiredoxin-like family protein n=1 Tax=Variovorax sp. MHTC-1 TaxID=2495593 RepID=UPI000F8604C7|nr:peroxiredoxin-like family protein [Variovorax sp. MHTC-1]RST48883.1 AhpC/TSA family protein [Variovorax sp. MHTC-1]